MSPLGISGLAHLFGILAFILLLVWLLHYREGIDYDSDKGFRVFNAHPLLMYSCFIFLAGELSCGCLKKQHNIVSKCNNKYLIFNFLHPLASFLIELKHIYSYDGIPNHTKRKESQEVCSHALHLIAIVLGIVGLNAVFKFHGMENIPNVYSLHSWIGIVTFCLFGLQWLFGFVVFMLQGASVNTRAKVLPWHKVGGRALLFMAVCAAETGLMEKSCFLTNLKLLHGRESNLINFTGLAILLFGVFVNFSVGFS
ncbi:putative transmembrane ascorbate ferrireductase 3 [Glycine max]|nr:putative transmembrane ascorbate ferrireductase 3 [Glycine max]